MNQIFIGKSIERELRAQERSVVWLARKLNCNRTNIYKIFNRSTIDTELLLKISNVLQRNFFEEYTNRLDFTKSDEARPSPLTISTIPKAAGNVGFYPTFHYFCL